MYVSLSLHYIDDWCISFWNNMKTQIKTLLWKKQSNKYCLRMKYKYNKRKVPSSSHGSRSQYNPWCQVMTDTTPSHGCIFFEKSLIFKNFPTSPPALFSNLTNIHLCSIISWMDLETVLQITSALLWTLLWMNPHSSLISHLTFYFTVTSSEYHSYPIQHFAKVHNKS